MMVTDAQQRLERRVIAAAEDVLARQQHVSAIDVLVGVGWLHPAHVKSWRSGRVPYLERSVQANLAKISRAMKVFRRWARDRGLTPSETAYVARTRDRRQLQFSKSGDPSIERAYRTHWVSPALSERKRERLAERASGLSAVVVRWSRSRKRYERQGILVEEAALAQAEAAPSPTPTPGPPRTRRATPGRRRHPLRQLLMAGVSRENARRQVRTEVDDVLERWEARG